MAGVIYAREQITWAPHQMAGKDIVKVAPAVLRRAGRARVHPLARRLENRQVINEPTLGKFYFGSELKCYIRDETFLFSPPFSWPNKKNSFKKCNLCKTLEKSVQINMFPWHRRTPMCCSCLFMCAPDVSDPCGVSRTSLLYGNGCVTL